MNGKSTRIILCLLLLVLFIVNDALGASESKRGVQVTPTPPLSLTGLYQNSHAVIIGVNRYEKWPSLEYAVNDAKAMEAKLKALGFETKTLIDHNATRSNIVRILGDELPRKVEKDDRVVIFFAGHGQTEEWADGSQMGYIIPVDADTRDLFSTAISMDQVRTFSKRLRAKHVLYLMDSCYSGLGLSRSGTLPPSDRDYLHKITTRKAHQMLTAGGKGEQAREEGAHGLFTKYLLEALDGQADRDEKGYITFSDLASYVKPKVSREAGNSQIPQYGNIDGEGEFVFVTGKGGGTDAADSRDDAAIAAEGKQIQSYKQELALERKKLDAERTRLAVLKEQQTEKARIAEELRRLVEEKEKLSQEEEQRALSAKKAQEEKQRKIAEEKARVAAEQEVERLAAEQRRLEEERASFARKKAAEEKRQKIIEERELLAAEEREQAKKTTTLAMAKRPSQPTGGEIARDGRFIAYDNGTVLDTRTNLMWAEKDNGKDIHWLKANSYCENYRGGGYSDWRMPTQDELAELYDAGKVSKNTPAEDCRGGYHITELIHLTCSYLWTSERGSSLMSGSSGNPHKQFNFSDGYRGATVAATESYYRVLPVRSGKQGQLQ
jgi:uncharacterized caspase-like protein